jgi:uncharacterized membrane protein
MKKNEFLHLSDKLDILDERLDGVEKLMALQEQNLQYHIKRTDVAEQSLEVFKQELEQSKLLMIQIKFFGRLLSWVGGLTGFVLVVIQIFQALK